MINYKITILLFLAGVVCSLCYIYNGQTILADGTLKESFGFIPLSFLFYALSIVSFVYLIVSRIYLKFKNK